MMGHGVRAAAGAKPRREATPRQVRPQTNTTAGPHARERMQVVKTRATARWKRQTNENEYACATCRGTRRASTRPGGMRHVRKPAIEKARSEGTRRSRHRKAAITAGKPRRGRKTTKACSGRALDAHQGISGRRRHVGRSHWVAMRMRLLAQARAARLLRARGPAGQVFGRRVGTAAATRGHAELELEIRQGNRTLSHGGVDLAFRHGVADTNVHENNYREYLHRMQVPRPRHAPRLAAPAAADGGLVEK